MALRNEEFMQTEIKLGTDFARGDVIEIRSKKYYITEVGMPGQITVEGLKRPGHKLQLSGEQERFSLGRRSFTSCIGLAREYAEQKTSQVE